MLALLRDEHEDDANSVEGAGVHVSNWTATVGTTLAELDQLKKLLECYNLGSIDTLLEKTEHLKSPEVIVDREKRATALEVLLAEAGTLAGQYLVHKPPLEQQSYMKALQAELTELAAGARMAAAVAGQGDWLAEAMAKANTTRTLILSQERIAREINFYDNALQAVTDIEAAATRTLPQAAPSQPKPITLARMIPPAAPWNAAWTDVDLEEWYTKMLTWTEKKQVEATWEEYDTTTELYHLRPVLMATACDVILEGLKKVIIECPPS